MISVENRLRLCKPRYVELRLRDRILTEHPVPHDHGHGIVARHQGKIVLVAEGMGLNLLHLTRRELDEGFLVAGEDERTVRGTSLGRQIQRGVETGLSLSVSIEKFCGSISTL